MSARKKMIGFYPTPEVERLLQAAFIARGAKHGDKNAIINEAILGCLKQRETTGG